MGAFRFLFVCLVLLPSFVFSLTLEESAKSILSAHPKIKESVENYNSVKKEYNIAENGYYPTLDLIGSYGAESVKSPATNQEKLSSAREETSLVLTQNIFDGYATENIIKQQEGRLNASAFSVAEKADRTLLALTSAYLGLLKQKELLELSEENVKTHEAIFKQIKERSDSGFGRLSETQQAGSRLTLSKSNYIAQQNNYRDAISTFEKVYGARVEASDLTHPIFKFSLPDNFSKVKDSSFTCNPSVRVQEANIRYADAMYDGSSAAFYPKVDIEIAGTVGRDFSGTDGKQESASALLKFKYNLYNKGADSLDKEKYAVLVLREKETLANIKRDLQESVKFSWENYEATKERIVLLEEHKKYSKETLDSYQQEFAIGRRDLINLLDAEGEYYSARQALAEAKSAHEYAKYRLLDNMGVLTDYFQPDFAKTYRIQMCSHKDVLTPLVEAQK
ncbi:MAG: TolC family outer membrane protein [Sulfurospirillaceae bacterium]|nr:TolC family outer membrane protein [Sulfurospirillaceae bacterium]